MSQSFSFSLPEKAQSEKTQSDSLAQFLSEEIDPTSDPLQLLLDLLTQLPNTELADLERDRSPEATIEPSSLTSHPPAISALRSNQLLLPPARALEQVGGGDHPLKIEPVQIEPVQIESLKTESLKIESEQLKPVQIEPELAEPALLEDAEANQENDLMRQLKTLLFGSEVEQIQEQLAQIEQKISDPEALKKELNSIFNQVFEVKIHESREDLCQALLPFLDRLLYERSQQDREGMGRALANIIPAAITRQMLDAPEDIARAIAPETAAAIRRQIELDREAVIASLAPVVGTTIKRQVQLERDDMIDALYPIIGSTISKYLQETIKEINEKMSNALSVEGITRKARARVQGVSEAELILQESLPFTLEAVFLIHKYSGLVIAEAQRSDQPALESEMLAGMLTAIRSFVNDCISRNGSISEVNEIEYGDSCILLEVAGYCYLATLVQGSPPRSLIANSRQILATLVQKHGDSIQNYAGDPATIPAEVTQTLTQLVQPATETRSTGKFPWAMVGLATVLLLAAIVPIGIWQYHQQRDRAITTATTEALLAAPELSIYNLKTQTENGKLRLTGRVPHERLRQQADRIVRSTVQTLDPDRSVENRVLTVRVPFDPVLTAAEVKRVTHLLNQQDGIQIAASYQIDPDATNAEQPGIVVLTGTVPAAATQTVKQAFQAIPGVRTVTHTLNRIAPSIDTHIYFQRDSAQLPEPDHQRKIKPIQQLLTYYPDLRLTIIGTASLPESEAETNLALQRAIAVKTALLSQGIAADRLQVTQQSPQSSTLSSTEAAWLEQSVRFEAALLPSAASARNQ